MGPETLFSLLRPLYYSTLIYRSLIVTLIDPFKGDAVLIIKAPLLAFSRKRLGFRLRVQG